MEVVVISLKRVGITLGTKSRMLGLDLPFAYTGLQKRKWPKGVAKPHQRSIGKHVPTTQLETIEAGESKQIEIG